MPMDFNHDFVFPDSTPISSADSSFDLGVHAGDKADADQDGSGEPSKMSDINTTYLKTLQLISLTEQLQTSSRDLKDQYHQLEKLGLEVTEAIANLKSAANTVNPKT